MRYSNLHNHSTFSDGKHTLEENVLSAIDKNMLSLGFSDHSFTPCDTSYCMKQENCPAYLAQIDALKKKYADRIPLYAGIELDYYSTVDRSAFDYVLTSVHYIVHKGVTYAVDHSLNDQLRCVQEVFGGDIVAMAKTYFDMVAEHVERTKPDFVGHFDVITKYSYMPEHDDNYRQAAADALKRVLRTCPYVEMNTGAIAKGWRKVPYPCEYLLPVIKENGGEIVLNADSHNCNNLIFYFDEAVQLLKNAGFDHINVFNGTGFDKLPIE